MADDFLAAESGPWLPSDRLFEPYLFSDVFGNNSPVVIELGAGDGGFILELARRCPECNFVATERLLGRARKIAKRALRQGLANLKVLRLESYYFIKWLCMPGAIAKIIIMYPDPWPKRRHSARRLIQPEFIHACRIALETGGTARLTTDHAEYFEFARTIWRGQTGWKETGPWDASKDPPSDFEKQFTQEGRPAHRTEWMKL